MKLPMLRWHMLRDLRRTALIICICMHAQAKDPRAFHGTAIAWKVDRGQRAVIAADSGLSVGNNMVNLEGCKIEVLNHPQALIGNAGAIAFEGDWAINTLAVSVVQALSDGSEDVARFLSTWQVNMTSFARRHPTTWTQPLEVIVIFPAKVGGFYVIDATGQAQRVKSMQQFVLTKRPTVDLVQSDRSGALAYGAPTLERLQKGERPENVLQRSMPFKETLLGEFYTYSVVQAAEAWYPTKVGGRVDVGAISMGITHDTPGKDRCYR